MSKLAGDSAVAHGQHSYAGRVAGVALSHISNRPPYPFHDGTLNYGHLAALEDLYGKAQECFRRVGFAPDFRGSWDPRLSKLVLYADAGDSPAFSFLVNRRLLDTIAAERTRKGADLSQNELLRLALCAGSDAAAADFTPDALNTVNAVYYRSPLAFDPSARLATLFTENRPLNRAFGTVFAGHAPAGRPLRVKELCAGGKHDHWQHIAAGLRQARIDDLEVVLSDFVPLQVDPAVRDGLRVATEQYSLFDAMPPLPAADRYDGMLVTYGFDSVWQPEDVRLTRIGDKWYQTLYRIKVADWAPRRDELLQALRQRQPLAGATAYDYDGVVVETAMEPIDITAHPFVAYLRSHDRPAVNFPGGLIKRVVNAFETQLTDQGVFISADTGDFGFSDEPFPTETDTGISGIIGRYHMDDYRLAQRILAEEFGFDVRLWRLHHFADTHLPADWRTTATPRERRLDDMPWNGVLVVRRQRRV